jgi:hypothetical protein
MAGKLQLRPNRERQRRVLAQQEARRARRWGWAYEPYRLRETLGKAPQFVAIVNGECRYLIGDAGTRPFGARLRVAMTGMQQLPATRRQCFRWKESSIQLQLCSRAVRQSGRRCRVSPRVLR